MGYAPRDMSSAVTTIAPATELNLRADMTFATRNRWAMADIGGGARLWRLAWALGWLDIRLRYRGSMLGPFWLTISTGVMVAALGVLYSTLFKINVRDYLPFLALSQVLWGFLAALVSEACTVFTDAEGVIRSVRMPFFVFSMRALIRNVIALGHNIVVIVVVFAIFSMWPHWGAHDGDPRATALGGRCAGTDLAAGRVLRPLPRHPADREQRDADRFFHDTGDLEAGLSSGPPRIEKLALNPFFDLLEIVRGPILGSHIAATTWVGAIGYSVVLCAISWAFFVRARGRVTFWV